MRLEELIFPKRGTNKNIVAGTEDSFREASLMVLG